MRGLQRVWSGAAKTAHRTRKALGESRGKEFSSEDVSAVYAYIKTLPAPEARLSHNVIAARKESPEYHCWFQARGRAWGAALHSAQAGSTTAVSTLRALLQNKFALLLELGPVDLALGEALL